MRPYQVRLYLSLKRKLSAMGFRLKQTTAKSNYHKDCVLYLWGLPFSPHRLPGPFFFHLGIPFFLCCFMLLFFFLPLGPF